MIRLRIHGDNIIECERTLNLIAWAYKGRIIRKTHNLFFPSFNLFVNNVIQFEIELFSGHARWKVDIGEILARYGSPLRESTDAYVTKILPDNQTEEIILAVEYCNALPAGNNAWQRSGRAIASAEIGIPYFYYAEVGGVELDSNRKVKAPRFPNPIVPFSYLTAGATLKVVCIPIYEPHPAITEKLRNQFLQIFGLEQSLTLIKCIIDETNTEESINILLEKGLSLVKILSKDRKRKDTLKDEEWSQFLELETGQEKAFWLESDDIKQIWKKKSSDKVNVTATFKKLLSLIQKLDCLSIGAKEIPICLLPADKQKNLSEVFSTIYDKQGIKTFIAELNETEKPIVIVWITGFKPRGDDSRPDRGLVPLARMLFGNDVEILTIVYGPAKPITWTTFKNNPDNLPKMNGLWESIFNLSNFIFVDSATSINGALFHVIKRDLERKKEKIVFAKAGEPDFFSEHDVDTSIHQLFSHQEKLNIFESMCNPPGGDWSGITI